MTSISFLFFFPETSPTRNSTHAPVLGLTVREQYHVLHSAQVSTLYFVFENELWSNIRLLITVQPPLEKSVKNVQGTGYAIQLMTDKWDSQ
jgi:hypothetical protein